MLACAACWADPRFQMLGWSAPCLAVHVGLAFFPSTAAVEAFLAQLTTRINDEYKDHHGFITYGDIVSTARDQLGSKPNAFFSLEDVGLMLAMAGMDPTPASVNFSLSDRTNGQSWAKCFKSRVVDLISMAMAHASEEHVNHAGLTDTCLSSLIMPCLEGLNEAIQTCLERPYKAPREASVDYALDTFLAF